MRATVLVCLTLLTTALAVSACGGTEEDSGSNEALIQWLGRSSTALKGLLDRRVDADAQPFAAAQRSNAIAILGGDVTSAGPRDVADLLRIQQSAVRSSERGLARVRALQADYRRAIVDVDAHVPSASSALRKFARTYDALVASAQAQVAIWSQQLALAVRSNKACVRAWQAVIHLQKTGQSDGVRSALLSARRATQRFASAVAEASAAQSVEQRVNDAAPPLVEQANDSPEVSRLVDAIRTRYPSSVLNDLIVKPEGSS